jgi:hypothetical protein
MEWKGVGFRRSAHLVYREACMMPLSLHFVFLLGGAWVKAVLKISVLQDGDLKVNQPSPCSGLVQTRGKKST